MINHLKETNNNLRKIVKNSKYDKIFTTYKKQ